MTKVTDTPLDRLAIKVVNLRDTLEIAQQMLAKDHSLVPGCDEDRCPSFYEASHFYAQVRKVKASVTR